MFISPRSGVKKILRLNFARGWFEWFPEVAVYFTKHCQKQRLIVVWKISVKFRSWERRKKYY